MHPLENLEGILKIQRNNYGYATIRKVEKGFTVERRTVKQVYAGHFPLPFVRDSRNVGSPEEALKIAEEFADYDEDASHKTPKICYFCGSPIRWGKCIGCWTEFESFIL